jgi:uncharacterized damage-inducible protein DinB
MSEHDRFISLFTQQVQHTWDTVAAIGPNVWTTVPIDSEANYLGLRVNRITVAALLRHLCLTETLWFETLPKLGAGAVMAPPSGNGPLDDVAPGDDLLATYERQHLASLDAVRAYSYDVLAKPFIFVGRHFTVRGFLWAIYGHHCYHVGQVDQLMRQQNVMPPEFLEYCETDKLIA